MAITNYTELKTELANWLDRADLTAVLDTFIQLAEININTDLRLRIMESTVSIPLTLGVTDYSVTTFLPSLLDLRSVISGAAQKDPIEYYAPEAMSRLWGNDPNGRTRGFTLVGDNIRIAPAPDSTHAVNLSVTYFKGVTPLGPSNPTNSVLDKYPNIYLYGSLLQAEPYLKDDGRITIWQTLYVDAVRKAQASEGRAALNAIPPDKNVSV